MIQRQSHSTIYVIDQMEAFGFYRDNLGFEVRTDIPVTHEASVRWLTLSPKVQPDLELVLMPIIPRPVFDAEAAGQMKALVRSGAIGIGVFDTDGVRGDYERLSRLGVELISPPEEWFYGTEAIVKDNSGNRFSLIQRKG